jgi:hypothetical protein
LTVDLERSVDDWTLADWCDQCHRKGGLVFCTEDFAVGMKLPELHDGEVLADLVLGKIDAVEHLIGGSLSEFAHTHWYSLLNCGCRVPLIGSSGKSSNVALLGRWRSYARLQAGEEFTYTNWIEAVRAGRTFLTNGPMLSFTLNGQDPGAVIDLTSLDQPVHIAAELRSLVPVDTLEVVLNGEVYHQAEPLGSPAFASIHVDAKLPAAGWLAARCSGPRVDPENKGSLCFGAHTGPIYIEVGGRPPPANSKSLAALLERLDKMLARMRKRFPPGNGHSRNRLIAIFEDARKTLLMRGQA